HDHAGDVVAQVRLRGREGGELGDVEPDAQRAQVRGDDLASLGVHAAADDHALAARVPDGQEGGLGGGRGAVVHRGVADVEARELAHHRLVLEGRLEDALGNLGLV